jgi:tetratricopeptide (TPR) repeat protein
VILAALLLPVLGAAASLEWRDAAETPVPSSPSADAPPRLLYFTATWCQPCRLLAREVFEHPTGQAELARYDLVHVDLDSPAGQRLSDRYRVATVPTFVVVDETGREVDRIRGYRSRRLLLRDLQRIRSGEGTLADLTRRLARSPDDPTLLAALGLRHYERLDLGPASELLDRGLDQPGALDDTLAAEAGRALADLRRRQDDLDAAVDVLERLLRDHPQHLYPRATWQLLAEYQADRGDTVAVATARRGAARVAPVRSDALVSFAEAAARVSRYLDEAETAARQAVAMTDGADPEAHAALASVLRRRGEYPEALVWIKRAIALAPESERWQAQWRRLRQAAIRGD